MPTHTTNPSPHRASTQSVRSPTLKINSDLELLMSVKQIAGQSPSKYLLQYFVITGIPVGHKDSW